MKKFKNKILILALCFSSSLGFEQKASATIYNIGIYYELAQDRLVKNYRENQNSLDEIEKIIKNNTERIESIEVIGIATPEGGDGELNKRLAWQRGMRTLEFINSLSPEASEVSSLVETRESWDLLQEQVEQSEYLFFKDEVLEIIKSNMSHDEKRAAIKQIDRGAEWRRMEIWVFPLMRIGSLVSINLRDESPRTIIIFEASAERNVKQDPKIERIAAKTNFLYNALLMPNISLEIPIGRKWSIEGSWLFPWWVSRRDDKALQIIYGSIEGRYWFNDDEPSLQLCGWFAGLSAGGGKYDLEKKNEGYQGEFMSFGLNGGFAHTISPSGRMRMEYSLGIGYLGSRYWKYYKNEESCCLTKKYRGNTHWFGPVSAEVSLVWMLEWVNKRKSRL